MKPDRFAALAAAFFALVPLAAQPAPDAAPQRNFVMLVAKHDYDLHPHRANYSSEAQVLSGLYEGLFSYDPKTLEPVPALAAAHKVSRDKKRWTFTIREGARFSDGEPITARSVRDAWLRLLATPAAPYASLLDSIVGARDFRTGVAGAETVGIAARDERTLVVTLETPMAHLPSILCHHAYAAVSDREDVYSGAFVLKSGGKDTLVLEKNPYYWDAQNVLLPSITVVATDDATEDAWQFNTGHADWIVSMADTAVLLNKNALRIAPEFGTEYLFFSCKNAVWDNAAFRNALIEAVPWSVLRGQSLVPATTLIYPLAGYPAVEGLTDTSPEDAADLMKQARAEAGIPADQTLPLVFAITESERMKKMYEILRDAWLPLGVDVQCQKTSEARYLHSIPSWNADVFTYSWIGDFADPLAFLELFREGSTLNQTAWKHPAFTQLLADAAMTTDGAERNKLLAQAEQVLLDDGVVMPLSHSVCLHVISPTAVGGWYMNALDIHPFKYLYFKAEPSTVPNVVRR
ncbi:MAG: peptide ABC transporter substrate-binding protein [Treponemataceae bacterium]|nr:peptide ABC transporter substrate-binding protein [Treponemataceae bacterium]MDE7391071.1 peptide ABC transporter substrate-binding protein [Treponemataceae bacterium]